MNLLYALKSALTTGSTTEFHRCVSALGVPAAAKIIGTCLGDMDEDVEARLRSNRHLFASSVLRGIPGADDFLRLMMRHLKDSSRETTDERKLKILQAVGSNLKARDLADLSVLELGHQGARYVASTVSDLSPGPAWADAAVRFLDRELLNKFGPRLSSEEQFLLWLNVSYRHRLDHLKFLVDYGTPPDTDDQMQLIFSELAFSNQGENQSDMMALLLQARPSAAASYQIPRSPEIPWHFWHGKTLRLLLEAGTSLDREHWIHVFYWKDPSILVTQIAEVSPLIDLNLPSGAKVLLLEEVYLRLIDTDPALRRPVLAKFLEVGANPTPLLTPQWQAILAPTEKALLAPAAASWIAKRSTLKDPSATLPITVDVDLA